LEDEEFVEDGLGNQGLSILPWGK